MNGRSKEISRMLEANHSVNGTRSRVSLISRIEREYNCDCHEIVHDDEETYRLLCDLKANPREKHGKMQNAVRRLYFCVNDREFPRLRDYR